MFLTPLCDSMSVTVEQFVEGCSRNRASDTACGIYTSLVLKPRTAKGKNLYKALTYAQVHTQTELQPDPALLCAY